MNLDFQNNLVPQDIKSDITILERHFWTELYGLDKTSSVVVRNQEVESNGNALQVGKNSNISGLLRLAMVGSAERTLQGEVFYALRCKYKTQVVLEMKVSEWHDDHHRNIDCVISPEAPNNLWKSRFIELGHHSSAQGKEDTIARVVYEKIHSDLVNSSSLLKNEYGSILHVMFITDISKFLLNPLTITSPTISTTRNWPRLPGYFVEKWKSRNVPVVNRSEIRSAQYKEGKLGVFTAINKLLIEKFKSNYIGCVTGALETVDFADGNRSATGQVARFYCYFETGSVPEHIQLPDKSNYGENMVTGNVANYGN